jgi:hypothetical protein
VRRCFSFLPQIRAVLEQLLFEASFVCVNTRLADALLELGVRVTVTTPASTADGDDSDGSEIDGGDAARRLADACDGFAIAVMFVVHRVVFQHDSDTVGQRRRGVLQHAIPVRGVDAYLVDKCPALQLAMRSAELNDSDHDGLLNVGFDTPIGVLLTKKVSGRRARSRICEWFRLLI